MKCDTLQRSVAIEREQRLKTEKDNEALRDTVSRQQQKQQGDTNKSIQKHQDYEQLIAENSKQIRSETERVKHELDRLRTDFNRLMSNYEPPNNLQHQAQYNSQIDSLRNFYENEFRQLLMSKLAQDVKSTGQPATTSDHHHHHHPVVTAQHNGYDHSLNGSLSCAVCTNSRLLKERLESAIDSSLSDQRIQAIKQMPILPRLTSPLLTTHNNIMPSYDLLRKRYYV